MGLDIGWDTLSVFVASYSGVHLLRAKCILQTQKYICQHIALEEYEYWDQASTWLAGDQPNYLHLRTVDTKSLHILNRGLYFWVSCEVETGEWSPQQVQAIDVWLTWLMLHMKQDASADDELKQQLEPIQQLFHHVAALGHQSVYRC